jgi:hypothetical protein
VKVKKIYQKIRNHKRIVIFFAITIPFLIASKVIFSGDISLWYDNARDLLSAWDNLSKPTLIGPTTGIPGIFYGPYWIWLLSLGLLISKDPALVIFITATLPYFIIFPLIWFKLNKFFSLHSLIIGWFLFMFSTGLQYATKLWNPYPAPLLTLAAIYLLLVTDFKKITKHNILLKLSLGFLLGLIINFHTSFGIAFNLGVILFLFIVNFSNKFIKARLASIFLIYLGFFVSYIPFLLFEVRHGFNQIQTIINTAGKYGAVVTIKGLTPPQIFQEFINTFANLIHLSSSIAQILLIGAILSFAILIKFKKIKLKKDDTKILTLILCLFIGVLFIFFTAKNPIWAYHFIGVDILFLLLLVFLATKMHFLKYGLAALSLYIVVTSFYTFIDSFTNKPTVFENQKHIVTLISKDAKNSEYVVMTYSPSIYAFEYTYLFKWLTGKNVPYDPSQNGSSDTIYLITPAKMDEKVEDFIHFRSPEPKYKIIKKWNIQNETIVLKSIKQYGKNYFGSITFIANLPL